MFRELMDYNRWHFALAQCPNGTFYYQPPIEASGRFEEQDDSRRVLHWLFR
jgi:hypothetical protein